jgi:hypothetical protein
MNHGPQVRQLQRAYNRGIISKATLELEMTRLEHDTIAPGPATRESPARGNAYVEDRAIVDFLAQLHATQSQLAAGIAKWASVCRIHGLRSGLETLAQSKAEHGRLLERRAHALGAELRSTGTQSEKWLVDVLANPEISDLEKTQAITALLEEPEEGVAFVKEFAAALNTDADTKKVLRLIATEDLSNATWLHNVYLALYESQAQQTKTAGETAERLVCNRDRKRYKKFINHD